MLPRSSQKLFSGTAGSPRLRTTDRASRHGWTVCMPCGLRSGRYSAVRQGRLCKKPLQTERSRNSIMHVA